MKLLKFESTKVLKYETMKLDITIVFELLFIVAVVLGSLLLALTFVRDDAA